MEHQFTVSEDKLRRILTNTRHAAATDKRKPGLNSIYLNPVANEYRAVANDGARIAIDGIKIKSGIQNAPTSIVPMKSIRELLREIGKKATTNEVMIRTSGSTHEFHGSDYVIRVKGIKRRYPPYQRKVERIIRRLNSTCICTTKQLRDTLKGPLIKSEKVTTVRFKTNRLEIETPNDIIDIRAITRGRRFNARFRTKYLHDIIARINGDRTTIAFGEQGDPLWIRDGSAEYMLMPTYYE